MFIDNIHAIVRYGALSLHKRLKHLNINGSEHSVIAYLGVHKSVNGEEISETLKIDKSTASKALSSLERKGIIIRTTNEHNRREKLIELTPEGSTLAHEIEELINTWTKDVLKNLSEEEIAVFNDLCDKVADSIKDINEREL
ncbi:MarR family winged helix-turn-helix transcriptional regulator [Alloiococcus sp. CFN-8]|uniref:MarR family winged helix-turn-helix transcriptional regulator n=1 Tax=Alloiococcus sp. CFN-8 TaxID=3416081 RepID=UPI003CF90447